MTKKLIVAAVPEDDKWLLSGYNMTTGKADIADAYFIGKHYWNNIHRKNV